MTINMNSITKTRIYRTIRDKIMAETDLSESAVRDIVGPLVAEHRKAHDKRKKAIEIAKAMLSEDTSNSLPSLMVKDGVVVAVPAKAKKKAQGNPHKNRNPEELTDIHSLMDLFRRAKHEHKLDNKILAKALKVSENTIFNWLQMSRTVPKARNVTLIAGYLKQFDYEIPARFRVSSLRGVGAVE